LTPWKWSTIRGVVWKNDGRTILLSAQLPGSNALQIWRVAYPEQTAEPLTRDQNEYEEATLAPNALVATHTYEVADLWSCAPPNTFQRLTSDGHNGADGMAVTPGGRVVYTVGEYAASQLWSMTTNNSDRRLLSRNGVHPSAAKVGETIAYVSSEGGAHHIWLVDSDGGDNHQRTVGDGENYPGMSPDGKWIFYVARAQSRGTLWKIPAVGGKSVQLTFAGIITNPVVSPDGKQIACTFRADEGDKWKIAILSADGGEPLHTFAVPSPFYQIIRWTSDSKAFTYLVKENGAQNIWRQPIDGSPPSKLTDFQEDSILHYDWSASGQQFILSRGGRRRDIVLMKNIE
jgi:Tol biopolymer transport system component